MGMDQGRIVPSPPLISKGDLFFPSIPASSGEHITLHHGTSTNIDMVINRVGNGDGSGPEITIPIPAPDSQGAFIFPSIPAPSEEHITPHHCTSTKMDMVTGHDG